MNVFGLVLMVSMVGGLMVPKNNVCNLKVCNFCTEFDMWGPRKMDPSMAVGITQVRVDKLRFFANFLLGHLNGQLQTIFYNFNFLFSIFPIYFIPKFFL